MFTNQALIKAKIDLYNISANYALVDYRQANFTSSGKRKGKWNNRTLKYTHIPYSLSDDTNTAREFYSMIFGKNPEDITQEQEEQIKGYLLNYRIVRTEYLKEAGGTSYYKDELISL